MNLKTFNEKILKRLKRWSPLGEKTNKYGTEYIGHYDKDIPLAFLHELHKPGKTETILEAEQALRKRLPVQYKEFLELFNGAGFFNPAGINVFGVSKKEYFPEYEIRPWLFPSNIVECNSQPWLKSLPPDALILGRNDGINADIICLTNDGSILEYDPLEPDNILPQWSSFDEWLVSEIENLNIEHDDSGQLLEVNSTAH